MRKLYGEMDRLLGEEWNALFAKSNGKSEIDELAIKKSSEVLFFPRKKLKMQKVRSGFWDPKSWFIQDRLPEKSTALDLSTDIARQGLTSGLRSAIIREGDDYFRLKGVALKTHDAQRWSGVVKAGKECSDLRGLCTIDEAYYEQIMALNLDYAGFDYSAIRPGFIEFFLPFSKNFSNSDISKFVSSRNLRTEVGGFSNFAEYVREFNSLRDFYQKVVGKYGAFDGALVSAFKIYGDTRVDEAFYELTKKKLKGDKRRERDELMKHISFNAGLALANFNLLDFVWSQRLDATNSHLGNFVIDSRTGVVRVGLTDFGAIDSCESFESRNEFNDFIFRDLVNFKNDFYADYTTSLPTSLPFREFPNYLRQSCLMAFGTGYLMKYAGAYKGDKYNLSVLPSCLDGLKVVVPEKSIISESDFRDRIKYVCGD